MITSGKTVLPSTSVARSSDNNDNTSTIPHHGSDNDAASGKWKDGLWSCFKFGLLDPVCCMPFCCVQLATAQVMTRLNLDWLARSKTHIRQKPKTGHYTFVTVSLMILLYYTLFYVTILVQQFVPWAKDFLLLWASLLMVYTVFVVAKTREHIRRRDKIPQRTSHWCNGKCTNNCEVEDFCCACCCTWCSVAQMARHTAHLKRRPNCTFDPDADMDNEEQFVFSSCCSSNGLQRSLISQESPSPRTQHGDRNAVSHKSPLSEPLLPHDSQKSPKRGVQDQIIV